MNLWYPFLQMEASTHQQGLPIHSSRSRLCAWPTSRHMVRTPTKGRMPSQVEVSFVACTPPCDWVSTNQASWILNPQLTNARGAPRCWTATTGDLTWEHRKGREGRFRASLHSPSVPTRLVILGSQTTHHPTHLEERPSFNNTSTIQFLL